MTSPCLNKSSPVCATLLLEIATVNELTFFECSGARSHNEVTPPQVRVNCVNPTVVLTELGRYGWENEKGDRMKERIPQRKFASMYLCVYKNFVYKTTLVLLILSVKHIIH